MMRIRGQEQYFDRYGKGAKTFGAITYFLPGMPLIYNGQEYGLEKRLEFFEKDFIPKKTIRFLYFLFKFEHNQKRK